MASHSCTPLTGSTSSEGRVSGYVLKLLRESLPRTQQDLAEDLGVQVVTVQGWESGRRPIMKMSARDLIALQQRLRRLGAAPALLDALGLAVEADLFIGHALGAAPEKGDPAQHLLGSWVITRPFTGLIGWPLGGQVPAELAGLTSATGSRRGPVPNRPALGTDERAHLVAHLQAMAERADRCTDTGLLLIRQAYYLLSFDPAPATTDWLTDMYRADRRLVRPGRGWSPGWPLARSTASALTRLGDPEPMHAFVAEQLDDAGERANLNYWAFWTGDLGQQHTGDAFMGTTDLSTWHGDRLLRHLMGRLRADRSFLELNIRTLHTLVRIHPDLLTTPAVRTELSATIGRLLDENPIAGRTRSELEALRYAIALAARH